jgi:hypothetical protein
VLGVLGQKQLQFFRTGKYPDVRMGGTFGNWVEIPSVAGAGGYSKLGTLHKIKGKAPMRRCNSPARSGWSATTISISASCGWKSPRRDCRHLFLSALSGGRDAEAWITDGFMVDLAARTVR